MVVVREARIMNTRNFRAQFHKLTEAVIVVNGGRIVGSFVPGKAGIDLEVIAQVDQLMSDLRSKRRG